jgi:hypothetical protein
MMDDGDDGRWPVVARGDKVATVGPPFLLSFGEVFSLFIAVKARVKESLYDC